MIMNFTGLWIDKQTNETIKISYLNGADEYLLEYEYEKNEFKRSENIQIFCSDKKHALLSDSEKFGRQDISIRSQELIQIGKIRYHKYSM